MLHGLVQKISDAAAMPKSELTGNAKKDAAAKLAAMKAVVARISGPDGTWSARSGDGSSPVQGLIFRAYEEYVTARFEAAKKPVPSDETIRAQYEKMERKEKLALRNVPEIAAIIERIKSERPARDVAAVDTDALLGDLGLYLVPILWARWFRLSRPFFYSE
jgi:hypothetical protein